MPEKRTTKRPRRSPSFDGGSGAGERAREKILAAAVQEFGAKGYAGARTAGIAARAGVNQQLISYYFGGKQGLLAELRRRWAATEATLVPGDAGFLEGLSAYLDATLDNPDWARLVVWQALGDSRDGSEELAASTNLRIQAAVERTEKRQQAGELTAAVEARFIVLLTYALAFAPIALPQLTAAILQVDPLSAEYRQLVRDALGELLHSPGAAGGGEGVAG